MKKLSIILMLAALVTSFSAEAKFGIGPKLGMNVNKLTLSKDIVDTDNRCGFTGGVTAEYIAPIIGLGADISLMYSYMTTEIAGEKVHGNFFEIPLHLKYKITLPAVSSIIAPYIFTGPSVAFKLGGGDNYFATKKTQWGWDIGVGLELIKHLQIGAGYTFGINNIADKVKYLDENTNITEDLKIKNNYWTITAAWLF